MRVVVDLGTDQKLDDRASARLAKQTHVPGPGLVSLGRALGGVDQDEGEVGVVEEHLVDKLVLVLPAEIPEEYLAVLVGWRSRGRVELPGGLFPDSHPVSGPAPFGRGGSTVDELRGEPRLADVAVPEEHDLRRGKDPGWCGRGLPQNGIDVEMPDPDALTVFAKCRQHGVRRMERQARQPTVRRRFDESTHLRQGIRSPYSDGAVAAFGCQ